MKKILFFVCTLLCANVLLAQTRFWIDGLQYEVTSTNPAKVEVNDANESITTANIPSTVTDNGTTYSVTSIGERAFYYCRNLTSVYIPNSIASFGNFAFCYCSSLTSIIIPNNVTSIGEHAFSSCSSLTSVTIPNGVTSIGESAFHSCSSLTSVTIPNSVTSIGESAFCFCSSLKSIIIPNNVTSIGEDAFAWCSSLTSANIPNSVTSIGPSAFQGCDSLTYVTIGNSVTSIGERAFAYCDSLTFVACLAEPAPSLGSDVFSYTPSTKTLTYPCGSDYSSWNSVTTWSSVECDDLLDLENNLRYSPLLFGIISERERTMKVSKCDDTATVVDIPTIVTYKGINYRVTSIVYDAFDDCSSLTSVTIPNSVTSIGNNAFEYCSSLTSITIPNSVTSIGGYAFCKCTSLTTVNIPNGVTSIKYYSFFGCSSLTSITIPNSVTSIGDFAFGYCSSLTSVNIPNGVTSIGEDAFSRCSSLTSVTIPNGVTSIGAEAFEYCSSLTSVYIPNGVTSLGERAFDDCSSLTSVTCLAKTAPLLGNNVFSSTPSTKALTYPCRSDYSSWESATDWSSVECIDLLDIGNSLTYSPLTFEIISEEERTMKVSDCDASATIVDIPASVMYNGNVYAVTSIGDYAFYYCSSLTSVYIPNSVTSIGNEAFYACSGLTSVDIPNSVTSIGNEAFYACSSLTSITIPNSVTSIGNSAFIYCRGLTSVTIPNSVTSIGASVFYNCSGLTSIDIPNSVTYLGTYAFRGCSALTSITCLAETAPLLGSYVFDFTSSDKTLTVPFNASGYTSDWGNTTWQKIYHKINKGETKTLTNAFEITEENKREVINEGVLRIKQGGQLINQTATNVEGIIEVEAINRANNWNYIGAPFANNYQLGAILPQANDVSVSTFNHSTGSWSSEWATYNDVINTGESFAAWNWGASPITFTTYGDIWNYETNQAGEYNFEQDPTYTLNNEEQITISHQDNNSEDNVNWLSVANPYTFKLDIAQIRTDNELQGDVLYTYNGATFQPVETGEIAVTEGFFVNNQSITLNKAQQHTLSAKTKKQKDYIRLAVNDADTQAELLFTQNDKANANYDRFDANKLFSPKEITEPYFVTDGQALVKEEVKELPYTATLNIKSYENKDITIKITNIPEGVNVFLLDNGQDIKMNGGVEYTTTITEGENADRFKVLFKKQHRLEKINDNQITITNNNRQISVKSDKTDLHIEVYNQLGQKVFSTNEYNFTLSTQPAGSYVIKAYQGRYSKSKKIVIE